MKVKKLIKKFYKAVLKNNSDKQRILYYKLLRKSLKGKKTEVIK